jgi:hypothetical protein
MSLLGTKPPVSPASLNVCYSPARALVRLLVALTGKLYDAGSSTKE